MQDLSRYAKRSHIEIQTKYLSFLTVVSIALVGLVFALGVLVGSKQSGESTCPSVDALSVLDNRSNEPPPPTAVEKPNFSFHESLVEGQARVPTPASLVGEKDRPADQEGKAAPKKTTEADLRPRMQEDPIPESVPRDEPGSYTLQVGSFKEKTDANEMVRRLQRAGYGAFLVSVSMPDRGGLWYRVRVGPFESKKEVWDQKRLFEEKEQIPAFVVKRRS